MPHLVMLYTPNLQTAVDFDGLCRTLADTMLAARDDADQPVFPKGGVRVLAYPAAHAAVADGSGDPGFIYFNLRMGRGRSAAIQQRLGRALADTAKVFLAPLLATRAVGLTLQIDEGAEVFDAKFGNLHAALSTKPKGPP
jgi:5-carboxymethyl-2-hydroxymuconate isomerase